MSVSFKPASKKQEMFIQSQAFMTVFGGAAGSGKTYLSLMRFLYWVEDPNFVGYVFRKNATDLKGGGGAFSEAVKMFTAYDKRVRYTKQPMCIYFPSGATINFTGLDGQAGMDAIQGIQISAAFLDEATHFTEEEIMWVISRLRTSAKMNPCIWLTCNPDMDSVIFSWIKDFYLHPRGTTIDGEDVSGRPIQAKDGVVRYYLKVGNETVWGNSKEEIIREYGHRFPKDPNTGLSTAQPKSFTFISATCLDNPPLLEANPDYVSTLAALPRVTRERLLMGNWFAREEAAGYFKREWVGDILKQPYPERRIKQRVRCFDLAASVPTEANPDPDWTVGLLMAKTTDDIYVVEDVIRFRKRAGEVEEEVIRIVEEDRKMFGSKYKAYLPQDPAAAGKTVRSYYSKLFASRGIPIYFVKVGTKNSKLKRFEPFSASAQNDLVQVLEGDWNETYFQELEAFDGVRKKQHDDQIDVTSDAFNILATKKELPNINAKLLKMS